MPTTQAWAAHCHNLYRAEAGMMTPDERVAGADRVVFPPQRHGDPLGAIDASNRTPGCSAWSESVSEFASGPC